MPWCPNCKNEYRDGITTCVDCNIPLVDSLDEQNSEIDTCELALIKKKNTAIRLIHYLRYSGISYAAILPNEEAQCYQIVVDAQEKKEADKHLKAFLSVESEHESENHEEAELDEEEFSDLPDFMQEDDYIEDETDESFQEGDTSTSSKEEPVSNATYVTKEASYQENKSSGRMFLGFSALGLIYVLLNAAGVLSLMNGAFSYIVITSMFVGFGLLGFSSLKHAKELSAGIDAERKKTADIQSFLDSLGDITNLDEPGWSELNDEILYFKRTSHLKELIQDKFGEQNEDYIESIVEEFYNKTI